MQPYYETPDGQIRIFHARWEDVLAAGVFAPKDIALVHADPPYGIAEKCDRRAIGRGKLVRPAKDGRFRTTKGFAKARDWPLVVGDEKPFDPTPLIALKRPLVTWGANYYASKLPDVSSWIAWDKRDFVDSDNNADQELAWSNLGGPLRTFRHLWRGLCRESESGSTRVLHPTQKPEALSAWVFAHAMARKKLKRGDTILVPYMGSGPDLRPAQAMGFNVIACEVAREYCDTAVNARLRAVAREESAEKLGPLNLPLKRSLETRFVTCYSSWASGTRFQPSFRAIAVARGVLELHHASRRPPCATVWPDLWTSQPHERTEKAAQ